MLRRRDTPLGALHVYLCLHVHVCRPCTDMHARFMRTSLQLTTGTAVCAAALPNCCRLARLVVCSPASLCSAPLHGCVQVCIFVNAVCTAGRPKWASLLHVQRQVPVLE